MSKQKIYFVILMHDALIVDVVPTFKEKRSEEIWEKHIKDEDDEDIKYSDYAGDVVGIEGFHSEGTSIYEFNLNEIDN